MKKLFLLLLLLAPMANATTYYVRLDGGTATQCTGLVNAAYPGSGTGQPCAVNHIFWLLNQSSWTWLTATNDTVQFEDTGPYYMNSIHNGMGQSFAHCAGNPADCYVPPPPDGTKIYGKNVGSCSALSSKTQLVGINFLYKMFWLQGTTGVDIECLDVFSATTCTKQGIQANTLNTTSLTSNVALFTFAYPGHGYFPTINEPISISGSTNGSGIFNVRNANITNVTNSQYSITTTQATSGAVAIYGWSLNYGSIPVVGAKDFTVTATTNGGGQFNIYSDTNYGDGQITAVTTAGGGTSGTFTFTSTNSTQFTVVAQQAETGAMTNRDSGTFTTALTHADVASAADTGTQYFSGDCASPGQTGDFANSGFVMETANAQGPTNLTMKDIAIHGMASSAILGSKYAVKTKFSHIMIAGNGESGFDTDGGGCGNSCESTGTINVDHLTTQWNGCVEVEPNGGTIGGNGYNYCVDQAFGGNGDGAVMIATKGTWNWSDITLLYNAQDGFDSLHVGDDPTASPTTTATRLYSMGNEGQSIKGGGGFFSVTDSIGISNCDVFAVGSNFPLNPVGWNALTQLRCRANDAMAFSMRDGNTLDIENVVNVVQQNVSWDLSTGSCVTNCIITFKNNATLGFVSPYYHTYPGAFNYVGYNPFTNASSSTSNNSWFHVGSSGFVCPGSSYATAYVCTDPLFVAESDINAMNVMLTSGSPLIGAGVQIPGLTTDFANNPWNNPPSIGAYEFGSLPPVPSLFSGHIVFSGSVQIH